MTLDGILVATIAVTVACQPPRTNQPVLDRGGVVSCPSTPTTQRLRLERVATSSEGDSLIRRGFIGFAPFGSAGVVMLVAGTPRSAWVIDSLGTATALPVADSVWAKHPSLSGILATPTGQIVLWEGATATAVVLRSDGRVESVHRLLDKASVAAEPRSDPSGGIYLGLGSGRTAQRVLHFRWPLGALPPDTLTLPVSAEGRRYASATRGGLTVNQRVPFYPEPVWGPVSMGTIAWSDGAAPLVRAVTVGSDKVIICEHHTVRASVTLAERAEHEAVIVWRNRYTDATWNYTGPRVPAVHPAVVGIRSNRDGRILLTVPIASRRLPPSETWSVSPGDSLAPRRQFEERWDVEVHAPTGAPVGTFALPPHVDPRLWVLSGDTVWAISMEPWSGRIALTRYRLVGLTE